MRCERCGAVSENPVRCAYCGTPFPVAPPQPAPVPPPWFSPPAPAPPAPEPPEQARELPAEIRPTRDEACLRGCGLGCLVYLVLVVVLLALWGPDAGAAGVFFGWPAAIAVFKAVYDDHQAKAEKLARIERAESPPANGSESGCRVGCQVLLMMLILAGLTGGPPGWLFAFFALGALTAMNVGAPAKPEARTHRSGGAARRP